MGGNHQFIVCVYYSFDLIDYFSFIFFFGPSGDCLLTQGSRCQNGACLDHECHCNDGYGGCGCSTPGSLSLSFFF